VKKAERISSIKNWIRDNKYGQMKSIKETKTDNEFTGKKDSVFRVGLAGGTYVSLLPCNDGYVVQEELGGLDA
jgi:hypothetical protein